MLDERRLMYIHGLEGTSQGHKATLLRAAFPQMLIPDFPGSLEGRMAQLEALVGEATGWTLIGSSLGGLMAAWFTVRRPAQVRRLVLLAPALIWPDFANPLPQPVDTPTVIVHGSRDTLIPLEQVRPIAREVFPQSEWWVVDDDHGLHDTATRLDWRQLVDPSGRK